MVERELRVAEEDKKKILFLNEQGIKNKKFVQGCKFENDLMNYEANHQASSLMNRLNDR